MANIVIVSDTNTVRVDYGQFYTDGIVKQKVSYVNRNDIKDVHEYSDYVEIVFSWGCYDLSYDGNNGWEVDTVDAVAPSDNSDLASKLKALMIA